MLNFTQQELNPTDDLLRRLDAEPNLQASLFAVFRPMSRGLVKQYGNIHHAEIASLRISQRLCSRFRSILTTYKSTVHEPTPQKRSRWVEVIDTTPADVAAIPFNEIDWNRISDYCCEKVIGPYDPWSQCWGRLHNLQGTDPC